jgi:hypothetical protein
MSAEMEITPFRMVSQRPLAQIYGVPADSSATVTAEKRVTIAITQDIASEYTVGQTSNERIVLDGESWRWTLAARYGVGPRVDVGIDVPYILYGGGFMDGFIEGWHATFGMPQGGRDTALRNRLAYSYTKDGVQKLNMRQAGSGIGDIMLSSSLNLYELAGSGAHDRLALRGTIKLPTGESDALRGSGSTDFSLALNGSMNNFTEWGTLGVFGSIGGMAMTRGSVLPDQQNRLAGFGTFGLGWGPAEWISFKLQLNGHTALYHGSSLDELARHTLMLTGGGALLLPGGYLLDIGVTEDVAVGTAPDVALHLGVSKQF